MCAEVRSAELSLYAIDAGSLAVEATLCNNHVVSPVAIGFLSVAQANGKNRRMEWGLEADLEAGGGETRRWP